MTSWGRILALAGLLVFVTIASGCTVGYRYTHHDAKFTRDDGRTIDIKGSGHVARLGAAFDFRYFRAVIPYEATYRVLKFLDENGANDRAETIRERRIWRLDVPALSFWNGDEGGAFQYPGSMRHRAASWEIWLGAETDLMRNNEWWVDVSVMYYRYNGPGLRIYLGAGAAPFRASTHMPGSRFPFIWEGHSPMYGVGIEGTFLAGEYALDAVHWLIGKDRQHRDESRRYGWE